MSYGLIVRLWGFFFFLFFLWMLESLTTGGEENPKKKEKKRKTAIRKFFCEFKGTLIRVFLSVLWVGRLVTV
jgi:hypothetical protein